MPKYLKKNNKKIFFIVSYRHPNQSYEESEAYFSSLNDIIEKVATEKPRGIVLTGDFNARSSLFWENDTDTRAGHLLSELAIVNNLGELVSEPTHIRDDGSQTCIDLIFTNQSFAFMNVDVIPHPERQSKHLIVHGKILVSHVHHLIKKKYGEYHKANLNKINQVLGNTDWGGQFCNKTVDDITQIFSENFLDVMSRDIPNKVITCNDKDAPWIQMRSKRLLRETLEFFESGS